MRRPAKIFIAADFVLDAALDEVARTLQHEGHTVVRGPEAVPGIKTRLTLERDAEDVGDTDVIVNRRLHAAV